MAISDGTRSVLRFLVARWNEASASERDPAEHRAFAVPAAILERAMARPDATHADIREAIPVCPAYPNFCRGLLLDLADAERDGRRVEFTERADGTVNWEIEPVK